MGFNFSHSLGAVLFGAVVVLAGRGSASFAVNAPVFLPLAVTVSAAYLALAVLYWFRTPIVGCCLGFALFASAWALRLAVGP